MNDNYLWDKSGEPDEEIQQLESLLSEFRYEPRPLALPEEMPAPRRTLAAASANIYLLRYGAIAATVLIALGFGVWLAQQKNAPANPLNVVQTTTPAPTPEMQKQPNAPPLQNITPAPAPEKSQFVKYVAAQKSSPRLVKVVHRPTNNMSAEEAAKEKVLYALQVTSRSLDLVRTKIQTDTN